jgi:hypothetical protein
MESLKIILASILLVGFTAIGLTNLVKVDNKLQFREIELKSKSAKLKELNLEYNQLNNKLDKAENLSDEQLKELQDEKARLEQKKKEAEAQLQAKAEAKRIEDEAIAKASEKALNQVTGTQTAYASSGGTKEQWMAQAGIPQSEWQYVNYIVGKESGWDPCAYNPSQSDCSANPTSACGLAQSLPCGKQSKYGHWTDPVANLKWQYEYVTGRYGGYAQAYNFWTVNHWY